LKSNIMPLSRKKREKFIRSIVIVGLIAMLFSSFAGMILMLI